MNALAAIGLYCLIFGLYWRIQVKRADRWKGVLLYALTTNFILCTMYFIFSIIQVQFLISVSYILQVGNYCSDVMHVMTPDSDMSGIQLIFEFAECSAERNYIHIRCGSDDHGR